MCIPLQVTCWLLILLERYTQSSLAVGEHLETTLKRACIFETIFNSVGSIALFHYVLKSLPFCAFPKFDAKLYLDKTFGLILPRSGLPFLDEAPRSVSPIAILNEGRVRPPVIHFALVAPGVESFKAHTNRTMLQSIYPLSSS